LTVNDRKIVEIIWQRVDEIRNIPQRYKVKINTLHRKYNPATIKQRRVVERELVSFQRAISQLTILSETIESLKIPILDGRDRPKTIAEIEDVIGNLILFKNSVIDKQEK